MAPEILSEKSTKWENSVDWRKKTVGFGHLEPVGDMTTNKVTTVDSKIPNFKNTLEDLNSKK
jgi:hypothetical protein